MHYRNVVCLLSYSLFLSSAWGCELASVDPNVYQQQGKGVVYLRPNQNTNLSLPDVNYKRLRRLANLLIDPATLEDWEEIPPLTDLSTDYYTRGAHAWYPDYSWHSDGRYIIYAGKIVQNPAGTPPVDVMSFKAWGDFAVDKNSIYYKGQRTDENGGKQRVDEKTLRKVELGSRWMPDRLGLVLRDAHFLYIDGHRFDNPESFSVVAQKSWGQEGKFASTFFPCIAYPFGPWDILTRTRTKLLINGEQLDADPDNFSVVRWMPGTLFSWRDTHGVHRKVIDQVRLTRNEDIFRQCDNFTLLEKKVFWRKGPDCEQEELPGLDPEQFHPISDIVAQYQDKLFAISKTPFGQNQLDIITLDNPNLIIDKRFNAGRHHGYLLTRSTNWDGHEKDGLQVFESVGPLILLDYHVPNEADAHRGNNPHYKKWFARDDRYVYAFDGAQLWRYPTQYPKAARIKAAKDDWLNVSFSQLDGEIMKDGSFTPTGIKHAPSLKPAKAYEDGDNESSFIVNKSGVRWRKALSPDLQWSDWHSLEGIAPKQFHPITERIAQYKNQLYVVRRSSFGEDQLETIELESSAPFKNKPINVGKERHYFLQSTRQKQDVQVFTSSGPLIATERFAYDNRYVYTWIDDQLYRTPSPCPAKTRVREENVREVQNRDIIIPVTDESCRNTAADGQPLKP